jgi:hypothetical protein
MTASLIIAASEVDSNLYYACRFIAPDPFVFLRSGAGDAAMSVEVDRARQRGPRGRVLSSEWEAKAKQRWPQPGSPTPSRVPRNRASRPLRCPQTSPSRRPTGSASAG